MLILSGVRVSDVAGMHSIKQSRASASSRVSLIYMSLLVRYDIL